MRGAENCCLMPCLRQNPSKEVFLNKISKKGYTFDPKKKVFRPREERQKICYNCGKKGHISPYCPKPDKRESSSKHYQNSSDEEDENKCHEKKKSYYKKTKLFLKKKIENKRSFMVEAREWITNVSSSEDSSDEDDVAGIAISNHDAPLPPPPMCLMARGNLMVSDGESDSDNECDPNEFSNLIHEYTCIIKREKGKVKKLESAQASLESSHNDLLAKYNALLKEHDESLVLSKQVSDQYGKLKFELRRRLRDQAAQRRLSRGKSAWKTFPIREMPQTRLPEESRTCEPVLRKSTLKSVSQS
jgi:hypothetical protein